MEQPGTLRSLHRMKYHATSEGDAEKELVLVQSINSLSTLGSR